MFLRSEDVNGLRFSVISMVKPRTFLRKQSKGLFQRSPKGSNGYHWDTIFIPEGETRTLAEMTEEKQSYAVTKKLMDRLKKLA